MVKIYKFEENLLDGNAGLEVRSRFREGDGKLLPHSPAECHTEDGLRQPQQTSRHRVWHAVGRCRVPQALLAYVIHVVGELEEGPRQQVASRPAVAHEL